MKINEIFIPQVDPIELFSIIEKNLLDSPDTQICIDDDIYKELCKQVPHNTWSSDYQNFSDNEGLGNNTGFHFKEFNLDFCFNNKSGWDLVFFNSLNIEHYDRALIRLNQWLFIYLGS